MRRDVLEVGEDPLRRRVDLDLELQPRHVILLVVPG
jgi:hypothetical protein